jgi:hypothetical protein
MRKFSVLMVIVLLLSAILVPAASAGGTPSSGCPPVHYRVVRGDNLTMIASRYGVSVWQVARWNGIRNVDRIYFGSVLVIYPARCHKPAPPPPPKPVPPPKPKPPVVHPVPPVWPVPPTWPVWPASCPDPRAVISSPGNGAHVSGMVTIAGNAVHDNFKFYKLEYGAGSHPSDWHWFFGGESQVWHGTLGVLNTDALSPGTYSILLTVVDKTSNYPPPCQVTIQVR